MEAFEAAAAEIGARFGTGTGDELQYETSFEVSDDRNAGVVDSCYNGHRGREAAESKLMAAEEMSGSTRA